MARRRLGSAASRADDTVTRAEVQALISAAGGGAAGPVLAPMVILPQVGQFLTMPGITGAGSQVYEHGRLCFVPIWVPVSTFKCNAIRMRIVSPIDGSTGTLKMGIYRDLPNVNIPDTSSGPLATAEANARNDSGGNGASYGFASELTLTFGLHWMAMIPLYDGAVSRNLEIMSYTESAMGFPADEYNGPDVRGRSFVMFNQTKLPTTAINPTDLSLNKNSQNPMLFLRRSS